MGEAKRRKHVIDTRVTPKPGWTAWVAPARCPHCGHTFSSATAHDDSEARGPEPGDVALCIRCGEFGVYAPDMRMRRPTRAERDGFATDPDTIEVRAAWERMQHALRKRN